MIIAKTIEELKLAIRNAKNKRHAFIPTMGALHAGHLSLIEAAQEQHDFISVSIFINPKQFNHPEDYLKYPNPLEQDLEQLKQKNVDLVFLPSEEIMYPDAYTYRVVENTFSQKLCGLHRPGHFDGVLSIVMKLLNLMQADTAFFGEKDYQQLELIRGMVNAFFMKTKIQSVATKREADGLAMSSRNIHLDNLSREKASLIYKYLKSDKSDEDIRRSLSEQGFLVDYVTTIDNRRYIAATIQQTRLIDNMELK